jgi:hypothetical protein
MVATLVSVALGAGLAMAGAVAVGAMVAAGLGGGVALAAGDGK